ncbi:MAG TPA: cytochrome c [Steroidobacteraceae bacterium]|nr:cytochrome c [Steroidobacteraceae bacterium]
MKTLGILVMLIGVVAVGLGAYFYSGSYPIGADAPGSRVLFRALQKIRARTIAVQASAIRPPADLSDPARIPIGAGHYAAMCSVCHLAPGYPQDETAEGLDPRPPQLARGISLTPAQIFWVLKHGLRMTGMPAWGSTHSNEELWDLTAFVLRLPHLTAQQYRQIVTQAPMDADMKSLPMPAGAAGPADH